MISETAYDPRRNTDNGNRYLIGNGYMGVRGTLEEFTKEQLAAVNLAGLYDQVGDGWREPLNAPNPLYVELTVDDVKLTVLEQQPAEHELKLHFREGVLYRKTSWDVAKGRVRLETERFADMETPHYLYMRYAVTADHDCRLSILTGIDGDVWDIYGPHYRQFRMEEEEGSLCAAASIQEDRITVRIREKLWLQAGRRHKEGVIEEDIIKEGVIKEDIVEKGFIKERVIEEDIADGTVKISDVIVEDRKIMRRLTYALLEGEWLILIKAVHIATDQDEEPRMPEIFGGMRYLYPQRKAAQLASWQEFWEKAAVTIEGDDRAMRALNYSLYQLHSAAPRHSSHLSIPARGLSGQTYKGAVFWDTEMFMLPFFLYTEPQVARSLIRYRLDTLPGALSKAFEYGHEGAFYAWESQEGGYEACSAYNVIDVFTGRPMRTYFRDKQIHISAAIVYGIMKYTEISGDESIWREGGLETVIECARFYYSLLVKKVAGDEFELRDVIGPDEYHERVNNNGYTNRMAKYTFEAAVLLLGQLEKEPGGWPDRETAERFYVRYPVAELKEQFAEAARRIYLPRPDEKGIIEQFDGYRRLEDVSVETLRTRLLNEKEYWGGAYGVAAETQVIKQADVAIWLTLFADEHREEVLENNWHYYEARTEHGSSLSACIYALLACRCRMPDRAYPYFLKSALADWKGGGKEWAGLVYIGGSHLAAAGGAYMNAVHGFAGISFQDGKLKIAPCFPSHWRRMKFSLQFLGERKIIEIIKENGEYQILVKKC